ncbi:predicted protein, partial [Postia placenta Mad-698-R]
TDTTSNTLARILQSLAEHSDVQSKLREELLHAGADTGDLSYDDLMKLPLLDAICRETLRLVPRKDSVLPLSEPVVGLDGSIIKDVPVPKGTEIIIGTLGSNVNKSLWGEDSLEWKPERWLSPLPRAVNDAPIPGVYSNLMTFLGGKRACMHDKSGFKFSEMEMKVVLAVMVSNFTFELTEKEIGWNVALVWYPTVGKDDDRPQLPLKRPHCDRYIRALGEWGAYTTLVRIRWVNVTAECDKWAIMTKKSQYLAREAIKEADGSRDVRTYGEGEGEIRFYQAEVFSLAVCSAMLDNNAL